MCADRSEGSDAAGVISCTSCDDSRTENRKVNKHAPAPGDAAAHTLGATAQKPASCIARICFLLGHLEDPQSFPISKFQIPIADCRLGKHVAMVNWSPACFHPKNFGSLCRQSLGSRISIASSTVTIPRISP